MKKSKVTHFLALLLSSVMVFSTVACGDNSDKDADVQSGSQSKEQEKEQSSLPESEEEVETDELAWLNSDGSFPIVEEGTEKTLRILTKRETGLLTEPEETWFYNFVEEIMNIDLEVITFSGDNRDEMISLTFAGGDLPDIIVGANFSTSELVKYGTSEEQIIDLSPYMNETYMPRLSYLISEYPSIPDAWTDAEGNVWSLGYISDYGDKSQGMSTVLLNYDWLEQCNLEAPKTLDEFYDMLVAFKALGEDIHGEEIYPLAGSWNYINPFFYILNAFGYVSKDSGFNITYRDGEVVLPMADREAFGAALEFMAKCYTEGLIHPDFFTMDSSTVKAIIGEGKVGCMTTSQYNFFDMENGGLDWWGAYPLTSEYNDTAKWPVSGLTAKGGFVITSACEEPELAATFIDWFYAYHNYNVAQNGPVIDADPEEWLLDMIPGRKETDGSYYVLGAEEAGMTVAEFLKNYVYLFQNGVVGTSIDAPYVVPEGAVEYHQTSRPYIYAYEGYSESEAREDTLGIITNTWNYSCLALAKTFGEYQTYDVPGYIYLDEESSANAADLMTAMKDYATQEIAKFVVGTRSLDTIDEYFDDMEALGAKEYVEINAKALGK